MPSRKRVDPDATAKTIRARTDFGNLLRALREAKGLGQKDLSTKIKVAEVTVSRWERGLKDPSLANLVALCRALNTTPNALLGFA